MADLVSGSISIDNKMKTSSSVVESVGKLATSAVSNQMQNEENSLYEAQTRINKIAAVSSLVIGSYEETASKSAYNRMNFEDDKYLNQIGVGYGGENQQALDNYLDSVSFQSTTSGVESAIYGSSSVTITPDKLTSHEMDSIRSTGQISYDGIDYKAKINSDGSATFDTSQFGGAFDTKSAPTINIDPVANISSVQASVNYNSLSQSEKDSISSHQYFERGGIRYNANQDSKSDFVNISANVGYNDASYNAMRAQFNAPFSETKYEMRASSLSSSMIDNVSKNGTYDLGGMKFSILPTETIKNGADFGKQYQTFLNNANNELANKRIAMSAGSTKDKAKAIAEIQNAGIRAIKEAGISGFNGRNANSCLMSVNSQISKLLSTKPAEYEKQLDALKNQRFLLQGYISHGGKIHNPTANRRNAGRRYVAQYMLGSDMMRGVDFVKTTGKVATVAYAATTGLTANLAYVGSSAMNKVLQKGIGAVAGKGNVTAIENLKKIQEKKQNLYLDRKDRIRAKKSGTLREYKRNKRNEKWISRGTRIDNSIDKLAGKRNLLSENGKLTASRDKVLSKRKARLEKRKDRFSKLSEFRAKLPRRGALKRKLVNKLNSSKVGKTVLKVFRLPGSVMQLFKSIKFFVIKAIAIAVGCFLVFIAITDVILYFSYVATKFISDGVLPSDAYARLNNVNYMQMIVEITEEDIVSDLQLICEVDATNHYLSKRQIQSRIQKEDGEVVAYPWYMAANMGEIDHVWAWEEADNTSRYANEDDELSYTITKDEDEANDPTLLGCTGDLIYANSSIPAGENGNTYLPQSERTDMDDIEANLVPIVTMAHHRYYDNINFETWPTVLGYTYYMYSVSHDIARYDSNAEYNRYLYGDDKKDEGYDYRVENACDLNTIYADGIEWDPFGHFLTRGEEFCCNIYVHDFPKEGYTSPIHSVTVEHSSELAGGAYRTIRSIAQTANKIISKVTGNQHQLGDTFDKGYTNVNDVLTLNLRKASLKGIRNNTTTDPTISNSIEQIAYKFHIDIYKNESGIFIYDGTEDSLPHSQPDNDFDTKTFGNSDCYSKPCDNVKFFQYGVYANDATELEEDLWLTNEGGNCDHGVHNIGCFEIDPNKCPFGGRSGEWEESYHTSGMDIEETYTVSHDHTLSCCDTSHTICGHDHAEWHSEEDPGCWKTVAICGGHCGAHITPLVNIVQKMTYEGLAQDDNFRTPYWLQREEITNSAAYAGTSIYGLLDKVVEDHVVTVGQFRAYWKLKCNSWFVPIPRSPYAFVKTMTKSYISMFCQAWDNFAEGFNNIVRNMFGVENNASEPKDTWDPIGTQLDLWGWPGWWKEPNQIDTMMISEMEDFGGAWRKDQYKLGIANWKEFQVEFGAFGIKNPVYNEDEINEIIDMISRNYDFNNMEGLSAKQKAILMAALSRCGTFSYSLTGTAHNNAIDSDSGRGDCSGWVTGTLLKALGVNYNTSAAGFANKGVYNGKKLPGSVIANKSGGTGKNGNTYTGHVMIYAGYLSDGPDGPGHYVMDCSSSQKGSSFRKVSQATLDSYPYVWNP